MNFKKKLSDLRGKLLSLGKSKLYKKTFIFDNDEYYNVESGEKANRAIASRGHIIQISSSSITNFVIKEKKAHMKYIYQSKDKKNFVMSSSLTTNFLEKILFDRYSTNMFVLRFPSYLIVFFGKGNQKVISIKDKDEEDIENILETTFQGLKYVDVEFSTIFGLMNNSNNMLPIVLIVSASAFFLYMYSSTQEQEEEEWQKAQKTIQNHRQAQENQEEITNSTVVGIINTNNFIEQLLSVKLPVGSFIGNVDFGSYRATLYSFAPMQKSDLRSNFFQRNFIYQRQASFRGVPFKVKTASECLVAIGNRIEATELNSIGSNQIKFTLISPNMSTESLNSLLRDLYRCPIEIRDGMIQYKNIESRVVQMSIILYKNKKKDLKND